MLFASNPDELYESEYLFEAEDMFVEGDVGHFVMHDNSARANLLEDYPDIVPQGAQ